MTNCCNDKACELDALRSRQSSILKIVLAINAVMFVVEFTAGMLGNSAALVADSLDMFGDALVYGVSLYVVAGSAAAKARVALFKGGIMAAFGLFVLGQAIYRIAVPQLPVYEAMGIISLLAMAANGACAALLWRYREDDINMRSVWLCSRNDIIANLSVLFAAFAVWLTHSGWPDILVGLALAALFLRSALEVLRQSRKELKAARASATTTGREPDAHGSSEAQETKTFHGSEKND